MNMGGVFEPALLYSESPPYCECVDEIIDFGIEVSAMNGSCAPDKLLFDN